MPVAGDTAIYIGTIVPTAGAVDVGVSLANLIHEAAIYEYLSPPNMYVTNPVVHAITNIANVVLTINPAHSTGIITSLVDPYNVGHNNRFRLTVPSNAAFTGSTGYTWSLAMDITHGTSLSGPVTRSYNTILQIQDVLGTIAPAMTFTTEYVPTVPSKPINPTPTNAADTIALGLAAIEWEDGGGADDFDVYFGISGDMELVSSGQAGTSFAMAVPLLYNTVYQWRIDANNAYGTTTGDVWSFTSLVFAPPTPSGDGAGGELGGEGGKNNMVTVKRLVAAANNTVFYEDA